MQRYIVIMIMMMALAGCSKEDSFLDTLRSSGIQYDTVATEWKDADKMIEEGKELFEEGKENVSEGQSLVEEGENQKMKGQELVRSGERLKMQAEQQYRQMTIPPAQPLQSVQPLQPQQQLQPVQPYAQPEQQLYYPR